MLFNSLTFLVFLPIVFLLYWGLGRRRVRAQNAFLLVASYVFYGWWDWRFLSLIFLSSLVDYLAGMGMARGDGVSSDGASAFASKHGHDENRDDPSGGESRLASKHGHDSGDAGASAFASKHGHVPGHEQNGRRRVLLIVSLVVNLGILLTFKYFGFFIDSFGELLNAFGLQANLPSLRLILPVGVSFYTFQTLSYTIDIYRRKIEPTRDPVAFFAFVSFFPQLVAGPIERASNLLPQFQRQRSVRHDDLSEGFRQILWGFLKKVVVADTAAGYVNDIFASSATVDGLTLFIGTFLFAIQIYGDFSGYSDIAIGTARLFGFRLMRNFAYPYFSRDIAEFWRRWHISLSTWFRDYVYIPMGGSYVPKGQRIFNIMVTFTVSGLWHGANWTFLVWGFLNGAYYIPLMLRDKHKQYTAIPAEGRLLPAFGEAWRMAVTFLITLLAWVFFRADSIGHAFQILTQMATQPYFGMEYGVYLTPVLMAVLLLAVEWLQRDKEFALQIGAWVWPVRWAAYYAVLFIILFFGEFGEREFIYFQF
ncbi:MBOAT family protein [bacterium]|nr:MBOAT family protein [bacterium]